MQSALMNGNFQKQNISGALKMQLGLWSKKELEKSTYSLLDFLAKICRLLESEKVSKLLEAGCFLKQLKSSTGLSPTILSLKTSRVFSQPTMDKPLTSYCERLPTLGMMVNGNCLILPGFYPRIESGYTLSDILEEQVGHKYFLSQKIISTLQKKQEGYNGKFKPKSGGGDCRLSNCEIPQDGENGYLHQVGIIGKGSQGNRIYSPSGTSATISSAGGGQGAKTGLYIVDEGATNRKGKAWFDKQAPTINTEGRFYVSKEKIEKTSEVREAKKQGLIRRLTPLECERLQGFPEQWTDHLSDTQRYKQMGNAVSVPVVKEIATRLLKEVQKKKRN